MTVLARLHGRAPAEKCRADRRDEREAEGYRHRLLCRPANTKISGEPPFEPWLVRCILLLGRAFFNQPPRGNQTPRHVTTPMFGMT